MEKRRLINLITSLDKPLQNELTIINNDKLDHFEINNLSNNSRNIDDGYLFAAIKGDKFDGSSFIDDAIEKGAKAILLGKNSSYNYNDYNGPIPFIISENPRLILAKFAATFYNQLPKKIAAITGTNGKSSIATFLRQLWINNGYKAASLGTIGFEGKNFAKPLNLTTPDSIEIHRMIAELQIEQGLTHLALEASSHGLSQYRLHGLKVDFAAFCNLTQDHLDYHNSFENYRREKERLFSELLKDDGIAVINSDDAASEHFQAITNKRNITLWSVGRTGKKVTLIDTIPDGLKQIIKLKIDGKAYDVKIPLIGRFQAENIAVTIALALASNLNLDFILENLENIKGVKGRMELVGVTKSNSPIFVDFAHTPDALENAIKSINYLKNKRLILVFGCGGDRDRKKRPMMGKIAERLADISIVTDDNPRFEDGAIIRSEILATAKNAIEIGDRKEAIKKAISMASEDDIILIAGKGHESGQHIKGKVIPFNDQEVIKEILDN